MKETARRTRNIGWTVPNGPISKDVFQTVTELKSLIQRNMGSRTIEEANRLCDSILSNAEHIAGLENAKMLGGING
ncbi:MAG: hypothetical protein JEY79_18570 [Pseudodesulfovibrio sp.]|jgi:hypothetical protein|nr:hypothetical protein [Pseudodesulfovibrio sp.]